METNNTIISQIEREIEKLQNAIRVLKGESLSPINNVENIPDAPKPLVSSGKGYDKDANLRDKFLFFLKENKRFVHLREVADWIVKAEGLDSKESVTIANKISSALGVLKKSNKLAKVQKDKSNFHTYWGLPGWLDENNEIKKGHEYNSDYPKEKRGVVELDF